MSALAVITARGGSKSLPRKNVLPLCGKPLLAWTIEAALGSSAVTRTMLSTDDEEIAAVGRRYGADVPFRRPAELSDDQVTGIAVVLHAVRWLGRHESYEPDLVIHLQPTSPLRTSHDINAAVALLIARNADAVVSVTPVKHHPYWMKTVDVEGWMHDYMPQSEPILRRQDLPDAYALNGAIYLAHRDVLLKESGWYTKRTAAYVMPPNRSVDIDTSHDLAFAHLLLSTQHA